MKKLVVLALAVLALAAVPAALARGSVGPPTKIVHVGGRTLVKILPTKRLRLADLRSQRRCVPGKASACLQKLETHG